MQKHSLLTVLILSAIISSCSLIGLNLKHKTPKKADKYPEFTLKDTLHGTLSEYRSNFDVSYYALDIDVDTKKKYIQGSVDITFTAMQNIDTIQLDLYENMQLNAIIHKSDSLKFNRIHNAIFTTFKKTIAKGDTVTISVFYEGKPQTAKRPPWEGGFVWKKDKNKNPWVGVSCELDGASLWWPLKDHLSDEPDSMQIKVTVPKGLFCVSNGQLKKREVIGEKESFTWRTSYSINTYNATIYIGDYKHFTLPYQGDFDQHTLDYYVLPYNVEKAKKHFDQAADIIHFFESTFGEYPWWKDGYKLVESPYEGMEHQTAIAYGHKYKNRYGNDFDYIILHETAHEWWGNSVSATDYAEIWLHEGFATYSEALYVEHTKGKDEYQRYLMFYGWMIKNKRPLIGPFDVNHWKYKDGDVYMKGALLLHTLRNLINDDDLFFDIIKSFYQQNKYAFATSKDFIALVNQKTGKDYQWFFDQYLYDRSCPVLEWKVTNNLTTGQPELLYKWKNVPDSFKLPVEIEVAFKKEKITPSSKLQTYPLQYSGMLYMNTNNSYIALEENKDL